MLRSSRVSKDFSKKDIPQTPSMFPACIHHRLLTADPNTHDQDSHSARRHVPVSQYAQIYLQAFGFEQSPTMLMKGSTGDKTGG